MRIKIVKCEARNLVNIGNIDKFRKETVGANVNKSKLRDAVHDLFRGSLSNMKKIIESFRSVTQKCSDAVNELIKEGISYMTGKIGSLPFLVSKEEIVELSDKQFDEKHYFLIPSRVTDAGYTFYSMRVLPGGVPPVNLLAKRRIFQFSNEHSVEFAQSYWLKKYTTTIKTSLSAINTIGGWLIDIADEIDKVDNKLTNGLLVIGGLVAFLNSLVGVGIAANALIPGVGGALSKYGLNIRLGTSTI